MTEAAIEAIVPYFPSEPKKSKYLSFRACGFTVRESCQLTKITESAARHWRANDPEFNNLDTAGISDLKKQIGMEYLDVEFTRNFRLVLQKDLVVLMKSLTTKDGLTPQEQQYLLKIRQFYTPQQLAIIQQLAGSVKGGTFDFTKLVFQISREREAITIQGIAGDEQMESST